MVTVEDIFIYDMQLALYIKLVFTLCILFCKIHPFFMTSCTEQKENVFIFGELFPKYDMCHLNAGVIIVDYVYIMLIAKCV